MKTKVYKVIFLDLPEIKYTMCLFNYNCQGTIFLFFLKKNNKLIPSEDFRALTFLGIHQIKPSK